MSGRQDILERWVLVRCDSCRESMQVSYNLVCDLMEEIDRHRMFQEAKAQPRVEGALICFLGGPSTRTTPVEAARYFLHQYRGWQEADGKDSCRSCSVATSPR